MRKSPLAYTGNKFRQLKKLSSLIPQNINRFIDVFGGGADMSNINSRVYIYNELIKNVFLLVEEMHENTSFYDEVLALQKKTGIYRGKNQAYKQNFYTLRDKHNSKPFNPIERFLLIKHSFNSQNRENKKGHFNNPYATNRIGISKQTLREFLEFFQSKEALFFNMDFREFLRVIRGSLLYSDFIYLDPPYTITNASYNQGWDTLSDLALFDELDLLDRDSIRWGLSNVIEHNGQTNKELLEWSKKYRVIYLDEFDYDKTSYQKHIKKPKGKTREIYICNYNEDFKLLRFDN